MRQQVSETQTAQAASLRMLDTQATPLQAQLMRKGHRTREVRQHLQGPHAQWPRRPRQEMQARVQKRTRMQAQCSRQSQQEMQGRAM